MSMWPLPVAKVSYTDIVMTLMTYDSVHSYILKPYYGTLCIISLDTVTGDALSWYGVIYG